MTAHLQVVPERPRAPACSRVSISLSSVPSRSPGGWLPSRGEGLRPVRTRATKRAAPTCWIGAQHKRRSNTSIPSRVSARASNRRPSSGLVPLKRVTLGACFSVCPLPPESHSPRARRRGGPTSRSDHHGDLGREREFGAGSVVGRCGRVGPELTVGAEGADQVQVDPVRPAAPASLLRVGLAPRPPAVGAGDHDVGLRHAEKRARRLRAPSTEIPSRRCSSVPRR